MRERLTCFLFIFYKFLNIDRYVDSILEVQMAYVQEDILLYLDTFLYFMLVRGINIEPYLINHA